MDVSLDEEIENRVELLQNELASTEMSQRITLDEYIALRKLKDRLTKNRRTENRPKESVNPEADVHKSLQTVINERGIQKPPEKSQIHNDAQDVSEAQDGAASLSSTGKASAPVLLRDVDPLAHSLDEMIISVDKSGSNQVTKKDSTEMDAVKTEDFRNRAPPNILTPYRAVSFLSEAGMIIEMKAGRLKECFSDKDHLWRFEVSCGAILGKSDSSRKTVSREIACREFLRNIYTVLPHAVIPKYEVPEEIFIDPRVFHLVEKLSTETGVEVAKEVKLRVKDARNRTQPWCSYICTYYVGKDECTGESRCLEYAKLTAARSAYNLLSGVSFPSTNYFVGNDCTANYDYDYNESEFFQIMGTVDGEDGGILEFPQDELQKDADEAKREVARRKIASDFKRARKEEEEKRRNMQVTISPPSSASPKQKSLSPVFESQEQESTVKTAETSAFKLPDVSITEVRNQPIIKEKVVRGTGRGYRNKFQRHEVEKDEEDEDHYFN